MSDLIDRQSVIDAIDDYAEDANKNYEIDKELGLMQARNIVIEAQPVQPEIIRCKECVYSHMTYDGDCKYCDKWEEIYESGESLYLEGDFFCGFGERGESDGSD